MTLQKKFVKSQETAIAAYNWVDIASGFGYVTFYPMLANPNYILASSLVQGVIESSVSSDGNDKTISFTTTEFNLPQTINGQVVASIPWIKSSTNTAAITVTLKKVDADDTETTLGSANTNNIDGEDTAAVAGVSFDVSRQIIKKGEKLKVYFEIPQFVFMSFDPTNAEWEVYTGSEYTVNSYGATIINIPFDLDL